MVSATVVSGAAIVFEGAGVVAGLTIVVVAVTTVEPVRVALRVV